MLCELKRVTINVVMMIASTLVISETEAHDLKPLQAYHFSWSLCHSTQMLTTQYLLIVGNVEENVSIECECTKECLNFCFIIFAHSQNGWSTRMNFLLGMNMFVRSQ
jgi:hypothetical protein